MSESDTPEARLADSLKTPYPADGEVWSALLSAFAREFEELEAARADVLDAKFVTSATDEQLDKLASIFDLTREQGESDPIYRARLQVALRAQLTSATVDEIRAVIATLLDIEETAVEIEEPYDREPMHINIALASDALADLEMGDDEFIDVIDTVVAIGVSVGLLLEVEVPEEIGVADEVSPQLDTVATAVWNEGRWNTDTVGN